MFERDLLLRNSFLLLLMFFGFSFFYTQTPEDVKEENAGQGSVVFVSGNVEIYNGIEYPTSSTTIQVLDTPKNAANIVPAPKEEVKKVTVVQEVKAKAKVKKKPTKLIEKKPVHSSVQLCKKNVDFISSAFTKTAASGALQTSFFSKFSRSSDLHIEPMLILLQRTFLLSILLVIILEILHKYKYFSRPPPSYSVCI